MANYRLINPTLLRDIEFRALSPKAAYMLILLRLMADNIIALYRPDWEHIGELLQENREGRKALLAELGKSKLSGYPWVKHEDGYAWVVNGFAYEFGIGDNGKPRTPSHQQVVAVSRALAALPNHLTLILDFVNHYGGKVNSDLDRVLLPYGYRIDTLSIPYRYPIDTLSIPYRYIFPLPVTPHPWSWSWFWS